MYDLEMLEQMGFCSGIENYSRHLSRPRAGRAAADAARLLPADFLLVIDESPPDRCPQVGAMYKGDRARKETLVEHGFRLPSALDNRPLRFDEWEERVIQQAIYVSATPGDWELEQSQGVSSSRSSGPPACSIPRSRSAPGRPPGRRPARPRSAIASEGRARAGHHAHQAHGRGPHRVLPELGVRVRYLHSDIDTLERIEILRDLRAASSTCWSASTSCARASTCPRCRWSRSSTPTRRASCARALAHPDHRPRRAQRERPGHPLRRQAHRLDSAAAGVAGLGKIDDLGSLRVAIDKLRGAMKTAADDLDFELAAALRDQARELERMELQMR
jgi:protein-arginine kinase activator protein McsA